MTTHFRSIVSTAAVPAFRAPPTSNGTIKHNFLLHLLLAVILIILAGVPACSGLYLNNDRDSDSNILALNSLELSEAVPPNSTMDYLLRALSGLEKALQFFKREHRHVNLDAVIGTRIIQGSLKVLLERLARLDLLETVPPSIINHIRKLRDLAGHVSDIATPYIIMDETDYYSSIGPILEEDMFTLDYDTQDISERAPQWPYNSKEAMREAESDDCLAEVFGTKTGITCDISTICWGQMTKLGYSLYSLSHEIFYLQIAEKTGCQQEMQRQMKLHRQRGLRELQDTFCANMLKEANLIADNNFPASLQDLFVEQAALCGMLGYRQFFSSEWLVKILSWQDPTDGCYRWAGWPQEIRKEMLVIPSGKRRSKREEKRLAQGCLSHRTAVAASALSQYVRFVLEVWLDEQLS